MKRSATRIRWERDCREFEVWIVDETDCFRLDFIKKMDRGFRSAVPDMGAVLKRRSNLRFVYS